MIGGTSHTGKSTLAAVLGEALGWPVVSTDALARHPGRPWPNPKPHVVEAYSKLSSQTLVTLLQHHHQNMRPMLQQTALQDGVILEGNAVRPEFWPSKAPHLVQRVCLWAQPDLLWRRMLTSAGDSVAGNQMLIRSFWKRSVMDQNSLLDVASNHGWICTDSGDEPAFNATIDACLIAAR